MDNLEQQLVAPCGINCAYCTGYLINKKGLNRRGYRGCTGCRIRNKQCAFLKGRCELLSKVDFCYQCKNFPCDNLQKLDKRYEKKGWGAIFTENNRRIKEIGLDKFILEQKEKYRCHKCRGEISIHTGTCTDCDPSSLLK